MLSLQISKCCSRDSLDYQLEREGGRAWDSEYVVTMNAQEYVHLQVEFDLNHPYVPTEKDILNILSALEVSEIIEDDLEISEVIVPNVSFLKCKKQ